MSVSSATIDARPDTLAGDPTDEQLVERFQNAGCAQAASELVRRHLRRVRAVIFPMVLDQSVADDLTQETFLRAWRGLSGFRAEARFSTWLTRIAWNVVQDEVSRRERSVTVVADSIEIACSVTGRPDEAVLHRELDQQITAALASLSAKLRAAIVLTGLQQLSPAEAAELEGCSVATMYWRIHEARRLLEQRLAGYLAP
ncbi:MAG: sigma-70 family RNA polymerase sigma factor [Planctomycetaceae bacterium]|nr:sigma-70 family RNA polymerase sigma factor [Planctomycetaceae bacterium]